jgi:hypothetical protein
MVPLPTADAVGYILSPRCIGADFFDELLIQDAGRETDRGG